MNLDQQLANLPLQVPDQAPVHQGRVVADLTHLVHSLVVVLDHIQVLPLVPDQNQGPLQSQGRGQGQGQDQEIE